MSRKQWQKALDPLEMKTSKMRILENNPGKSYLWERSMPQCFIRSHTYSYKLIAWYIKLCRYSNWSAGIMLMSIPLPLVSHHQLGKLELSYKPEVLLFFFETHLWPLDLFPVILWQGHHAVTLHHMTWICNVGGSSFHITVHRNLVVYINLHFILCTLKLSLRS